jgi:hypothetical protein
VLTLYILAFPARFRALCEERYADWTEKFTQLGLRVAQVTGDTQHVDFGGLSGVDIMYVESQTRTHALTLSSDKSHTFDMMLLYFFMAAIASRRLKSGTR